MRKSESKKMKIEDKGCCFYLAFIAIINDSILKDRNVNKKEGEHIRKERIWYPGATYHAMARGLVLLKMIVIFYRQAAIFI